MDASNPILNADRMSGKSMRELLVTRTRQNLTYLSALAETSQRQYLKVPEKYLIANPDEVKMAVKDFKARKFDIPKAEGTLDISEVADVVYESIPSCGLLDAAGTPIHPPATNNRKGQVHVERIYGGQHTDLASLPRIMEIMARDWNEHKTHIYTGGSQEGLKTRILKQMGRESVSCVKALKTMGIGPKNATAYVQKVLGYQPQELGADLNGDLLDLIDELSLTYVSSAGPPYWQNKLEAYLKMTDTVMPLLIDGLKKDNCETLFHEHPELFVCELKNKTDRYTEEEAGGKKTRPYFCCPYHFSVLFSILSQKFQALLETFDRRKTSKSAYGFSSANGGLARFAEWMQTTPKNTAKFCVYGDDTRIVYRDRKGKVWTIDPDFTQMDGSVDKDAVYITVNAIKDSLFAIYGQNSLWSKICDWWVWFAINPHFLVEGSKVWSKKTDHGLMTGVPGTTLFDTVKSIISWDSLLTGLEQSNELEKLHDEAFIRSYMKTKCGLEIKEGTWQPELVNFDPEDGGVLSTHKFLGVQIARRYWIDRYVYYPLVPEEEILSQILSPKDSPHEVKKMSAWSRQRLEFDRMRGMFITSAFAHPRTRALVHHITNGIPGGPILMSTQFENGMPPETILLPEFQFPNSSGFPDEDFVYKMYGDFEEKGLLRPLFTGTGIDLSIAESKKEIKAVRLIMKDPDEYGVRDVVVSELSPSSQSIEDGDWPLPDLPSLLDEAKDTKLVGIKPQKPPLKYTVTQRVENGRAQEPERAFPTIQETLTRTINDAQASKRVLTLPELELRTGLPEDRIRRAVKTSTGLYLADGMVSTIPIVAQSTQAHDTARVDKIVGTSPEVLKGKTQVDILGDFVKKLKWVNPPPAHLKEEMAVLNYIAGKNGYSLRYVTDKVNPKLEKSVRVVLLYSHIPGHGEAKNQPAAGAWAKRALDAKTAIAKEMLSLIGVAGEIKYLPGETRRLPPQEADDWADEIENDLREIRLAPSELTVSAIPPDVTSLIKEFLDKESAKMRKEMRRAQLAFQKEVLDSLSQIIKPLSRENLYERENEHQSREERDSDTRSTGSSRSQQTAKSAERAIPLGGKTRPAWKEPSSVRNDRRRRSAKAARAAEEKETHPWAKTRERIRVSWDSGTSNEGRNRRKPHGSANKELHTPTGPNPRRRPLDPARPPPMWGGR